MNNKILTTLLVLSISTASIFGATSGTIAITGTVPEIASIQASNANA